MASLRFAPVTLADIALRTSDNTTLHVHKAILGQRCSVFEGLLSQFPEQDAMPLDETWEQFSHLMLFLYPEGPIRDNEGLDADASGTIRADSVSWSRCLPMDWAFT
jgi:hypothetical protein